MTVLITDDAQFITSVAYTMDSSDEGEIAERTWKRASEPVSKEGFREGHDYGSKAALQSGFDLGFGAGYKSGYNLGLKQGVLNAMTHIDDLEPPAESNQPVVDGHKGNCQMCPTTTTGSIKLDMAMAFDQASGDESLSDFKTRQELANELIFQDPLLMWVKKLG